jgi:hypothetical protein
MLRRVKPVIREIQKTGNKRITSSRIGAVIHAFNKKCSYTIQETRETNDGKYITKLLKPFFRLKGIQEITAIATMT